jgi:hypothetical protein
MLPFTSIDIAGPIVQLTDNVKMLTLYLGGGFVVVNILTFEKQVHSVCKSANYRIGSKGTKTHTFLTNNRHGEDSGICVGE